MYVYIQTYRMRISFEVPTVDGQHSAVCRMFVTQPNAVCLASVTHLYQTFTTFSHTLFAFCSQRKGTRLPILESKIQSLFEDNVKISKFQIFTDSDRKKCVLLYDIYCYFDSTFCSYTKAHCLSTKVCGSIQFHIVKKITKMLKSYFLKTALFQISYFTKFLSQRARSLI